MWKRRKLMLVLMFVLIAVAFSGHVNLKYGTRNKEIKLLRIDQDYHDIFGNGKSPRCVLGQIRHG